MNNNIEKNLGNLSQVQILEKDPSLKMLELSKNYLISIEKKFGVFLHKMGIDVGNYDGDLNGSKTGAEKIFNEKILPLKHKIEKEKHTLKKQDLLVQLTQAVLMARGIDMGNIQKLAIENGKDKEFQKESTDLLGNNEYSKFKNEIELEAQKFDDVYTTKESTQDKEKIRKDLIESNKNAVLNYKDGKISKETYEKIISNNMNDARKNGIELEVTKDFGKYLELGMQSGTLPVVMMMTPVIKKGMPLLPAVIGVGIYSRLINTIQSDKISAGDKVLESGKVVGHTALSIAPITGSIMAINDANNSWDKVKNGTGTKAEAIADTIGAGVSIIFDGVTIVMAATGVGAIPAIGVAASRKAGVEGTKFGLKKLISKSGDIFNFGKNALIDFKNSSKALAGFKSIINESGKIVSTGFSKETMKDTWKYIGVDSIKGIKDLFTFKVTRDELNRSMFKLPGIGDMYKKLRPTKYRELNRLNITTKLSSGEESLNKDLEYIDSKKNDLSNGVTKELIEMINTKLAELAKKKSESQKNGNTSEIKTLEEIELKRLNKIFDILDYRAKKIDELGDKKLKEQNDKEWAGLHKYLKSYIENPNISHDIKNEIIKGLWTDTIKNQEYGYLKDGTIQKHINDFLSDKSKNFEEKANFLILLADKKLTKQEVNGKNITDYTKELLNNLSGHELINNAYVLNRLFNTIPELKTDKTLINVG